jgi:phage-related protein
VSETRAPAGQKKRKQTIWFLPSLRDEVRSWPSEVREEVGRQLNKVEYGRHPVDFKPLTTVGPGVYEIRHSDDGDQYRLLYVAKFQEAVYILHVITKKKSQKTPRHDINVARNRYQDLLRKRKERGYD